MVGIIIHILQKRKEGEVLNWPQSQVWYQQQSWDPDSISRPVPSTILGPTVPPSLNLPSDCQEIQGKDVLSGTSLPFLQNLHSHCASQAFHRPFSNSSQTVPFISLPSSLTLTSKSSLFIPVNMPQFQFLPPFAWILEEPLNWFLPLSFPLQMHPWQIHFKIQALMRH